MPPAGPQGWVALPDHASQRWGHRTQERRMQQSGVQGKCPARRRGAQVPGATQKVPRRCPEKAERSAPAQQCRAMHGCARPRAGHRESGAWSMVTTAAAAAAAAAWEAGSPGSGLGAMRRGLSPAASELLETLLPAENDVQVKTSVEPKERTPRTRPRIETWPLASPGQKVFPIPGEEGSVVILRTHTASI